MGFGFDTLGFTPLGGEYTAQAPPPSGGFLNRNLFWDNSMIKYTKAKDATSQIIPISVYDSSSTTGEKKAGLAFNSTNLVAYYSRAGVAGSAVQIPLVTATKGTWVSGGFVAIDGTNMPGDYELHVPDAAFATGTESVLIQIFEVTTTALNVVPTGVVVELETNLALVDIVDGVWDEPLTGGTHNVANSGGKRLRQIDAAFEVHSGVAQAGTAGTITLDAGAHASDSIYKGDRIVIVNGTGAQEHGLVVAYNGTTKVCTMSKDWVITPDNTSEFIVLPADCDVETWNNTSVTGDGDWASIASAIAAVHGTNGTLYGTTLSKDATSQIVQIPIYDSSSNVGAKLAGLVFNTGGLKAYYNRIGAAGAAVAFTLATATKGTWVTEGFVAVDVTNQTGEYEIHLPNAAIATGAERVVITLEGAANMSPVNIVVDLVNEIDLGSDNRTLVSADAHTSGQTIADNTAVTVELAKVPKSDGAISWNATALAAINAEADTALVDYDGPTNAEMVARTLLAASYFDPAADTVANVTTVASNSDMRGTDSALLAVNVPTNFAAMVITAGGSVDALVQGFLDTLITETTVANISNNFDTFYDNANALTAKIINDVGVAGSGLTEQQVRDAMKLAPTVGSPAAGSVDEHLDNAAVAPDNAGITQIQVDVAALNNFNPATEAVANVTLVGTTSVNSDMRGTDGANTIAPDNAGITSLLSAVATIDGIVDAILVDSNELQLAWADGGRLDVILDSKMVTFSLPTNFADLDISASTGYINLGSIKGVTLLGIGTEADPWRGE